MSIAETLKFLREHQAPLGSIKQSTAELYMERYKRVRARLIESLPHTWEGLTRAQWRDLRAALVYSARVRGTLCVERLTSGNLSPNEQRAWVREARLCHTLIETYPRSRQGRPAGGPHPVFVEPETVKRGGRKVAPQKRGGKNSVRELKDDEAIKQWIDACYSDPNKSRDRRAHLALMLTTGARPEEIALGVRVEAAGDDAARILINGAKCRDAAPGLVAHGQPWRSFLIANLSASVAGREVARALRAADRQTVVLQAPARALKAAIGRAAVHAFGPKTHVSSYTARHYFSSGLHRAGLRPEQIAAALGQASTGTQRHYAAGRLAGSSTRSVLRDIRAADRVRRVGLERLIPPHERNHQRGIDRER